MKNKHITRFGNPTDLSGARYIVFDPEGLLQMAIDLEYARLYVDGVPVTPKINTLILDRVRRDFEILTSKIHAEGISQNLVNLLEFTKKSKVEKYAKGIRVSEFDLFLLIYNCKQVGFSHKSKFREYIPSELEIAEADIENLHKRHPLSFIKKITRTGKLRRRIHAHLFEKGLEWHCFYFSYNDIEGENENHFKYGSHLHYVSHLWTYNKERIWDAFDTRFTAVKDFHIKFTPFDFSNSHVLKQDALADMEERPMLVAINTSLPSNRNSMPIPLAQITTRGFWSADIANRKQ